MSVPDTPHDNPQEMINRIAVAAARDAPAARLPGKKK